jgi:alpha-tubulin suppressor-like RCC1 family protein
MLIESGRTTLPAICLRLGVGAAALTIISCKGEHALAPDEPAESRPALAAAATVTATFYQVSAGYDHTCGITTDGRTFCWGSGLLGNGTEYSQRVPPQLVAGGHRFRQVSSGHDHTCAISTDNRAYCWGRNGGQLGDGTTADQQAPVPVAGGRQFRQLDVGTYHTCAVGYSDGKVYCWGGNSDGQLGDGTLTTRLTPVAVAGSVRFREVSAGWSHTCAISTDSRVYCWGSDRYGQMGDGSEITSRRSPTPIMSSRLFRQLDAGAYYTCAVTTDHHGFCWGDGRNGQVGDGAKLRRFTPRAVKGGLLFSRVSAGYAHTCAESTNNRAYCWGNNVYGRLGSDPSSANRAVPGPVDGGLFFGQLSANGFHACGVSSTGEAYCWGYNWSAQLGDGTIENRSAPVRVVGAM